MKVYTYTLQDLQGLSNQVKEVVVTSLAKEGFLDGEQAEKFLENYIVMVSEKGFCGRLIDKFFKLDEAENGTQVIHVVKRT